MLAFMGLVSGVLVVISLSVVLYERHSARASLDRGLSILTEALALNSAGAVVFEDATAAREVLGSLVAEPSVMGAELRDDEGSLLATYIREGVETIPASPDLDADSAFQSGYFHVSRPIRVGKQTHGQLRIVADLSLVNAQMHRVMNLILGLLAVMMVFAYVSALRVQKALVRPLLSVTRTAERISHERDYALRAPDTATEEIASVVSGINHMLGQIQAQDAELRSNRDHLEQRVEERTLELTIAKEAAEDAVRVKSEFLANISHELRTPMHAILSFADLGKQRMSQGNHAKVNEYLSHIGTSGKRLLGLLNELLDLSKLEAGKMRFELRACELCTLIQHAVDEMRSAFSRRKIKFEISGPGHLDLVADESRMMQVLQNVLGNAVRFAPENSTIWINFGQSEDRAFVSVRDQGPGVPEKDLERIFSQFEQSSITKTGAGGTGLGLAICREIMDSHSGEISADNHPEGGAIFTIELPLDLTPTQSSSGRLRANSKRVRKSSSPTPDSAVTK